MITHVNTEQERIIHFATVSKLGGTMKLLSYGDLKVNSIARKLIITIVILSIFSTLLTTVIQHYIDINSEMIKLKARIDHIGSDELNVISHDLWNIDEEMIRIELNSLLKIEGIEYVKLLSDQAECWVAGSVRSEKTLIKTFPIFHGSNPRKQIGSLEIVAGFGDIYKKLHTKVISIFISNAILIFLIVLFIFAAIQILITRYLIHIRTYLENTHSIDKKYDIVLPDKKANINSPDEIDHIISAINRMREELRLSFYHLEKEIQNRKQAEDDLSIALTKYRVLFDSFPLGIAVLDKEGLVVETNPLAEELLELTKCNQPQQLPEDTHWNIIQPDGSSISTEKTAWIEVVKKNQLIKNLEIGIIKNSGLTTWVNISAVPLPLETFSVVITCNDITAHKQLEDDKEKLQQQLIQKQKLESLGVLAGGIAHDFNNLLGGIFGFIGIAQQISTDPEISGYLSQAVNSIDRARGLTRQLLTFSKGGAPMQKPGNLFPFVQESALFALSGSSVRCSFDVQPNLWSCSFDKNQIGQVIDNIIINAQQAMPDSGTIHVSAKNIIIELNGHPLLAKGNYVELSIKDTGTGIPKEVLPRIFDPFYSTKEKGHGLGLATCYSIINRHNGYISVQSEPQKGTTFKILLPALNQSEPVYESSTPIVKQEHKGSGTILVMDDDEMIQEVITQMLKLLGYTVVCRNNGQDAIDYFTSEVKANRPIVAMIFDLTIPGGFGGKDAIKIIRKINSEIPVFVSSGYAEDPIMSNPAGYGFTGSLSKPFKLSELSEMLNKHLR